MYFTYRNLPDGSLAVAVTAQERFHGWLEAFKGAGLRLAALCPVTLTPPLEEGCWSIGFDADEVYVRCGELAGFACPLALAAPPAALTAALRGPANKAVPRELIVFNSPPGFDRAAWAERWACRSPARARFVAGGRRAV